MFWKSTRRNQPLPCSDLTVPMHGLPSSAEVISANGASEILVARTVWA